MVYNDEEVTPKERTIVRNLRHRLHDLHLPDATTNWVTDVDILRHLRQHHPGEHQEDQAWKTLTKAIKVREELNMTAIMQRDLSHSFCHDEMFWAGRDKSGNPTVVLRSARHFPGRTTHDEFLSFIIQKLEEGRENYGVGLEYPVTVLVDRCGSSLRNQVMEGFEG